MAILIGCSVFWYLFIGVLFTAAFGEKITGSDDRFEHGVLVLIWLGAAVVTAVVLGPSAILRSLGWFAQEVRRYFQ